MNRVVGRGAVAFATVLGVGVAPLAAQQVPAAKPTPRASPRPVATPLPAPTPLVQPLPGIVQATPAPVPLPKLNTPQTAQLITLLREAGFAQGLRHAAKSYSFADSAAVARAALDYARAVHSGRLMEEDFQADWGLRPAVVDPTPAFAAAVQADRIEQWFRSLPPPYAGYEGLKAGLATYRAIEAAGGWPALVAGADLGLKAKGPRVLALRKRLAIEDAAVKAEGDVFDAELEEAVKRAQRRYGLNPSGLVSKQTIAALNVPAGDRVRQIMANMERWRWIPRELPVNRIQVNIAAAVMTVFEGDNPVASMKAVTGKPGSETPMLQSRIHSVVLNPPWNVPTGIAKNELFPKGAAYLKANGFRVIGEGANRRLQQAPGPKSALGLYKFDFDNPYAVYLHDTPAQAAFGRFDRLASHGCVRLERPGALAQLLLRDDPDWQPEAIQAAIEKGATLRVPLKTQVAVYLLYWTAYASSDGRMNFRADPYGWDKVLADKIEKRAAIQAAAT